MIRTDGGAAFPVPYALQPGCEGMSLRDYFAAKAITGTCPGGAIQDFEVAKYAQWAYRMADAMLAECAK